MKALSLMQPWAGLVVLGKKDIENRGRRTGVRGEIAVHASMGVDQTAMAAIRNSKHPVTGEFFQLSQSEYDFCQRRGGIIGTVSLDDCLSGSPSKWWQGPYGYALSKAKQGPMMICRGMPGFFEVDYAAD